MISGIVIKTTGSWHTVRTDSGLEIPCTIKGKYRLKGMRLTNPIAVGDLVDVQWEDGDENGVIKHIAPRKNYIIRKSINLAREAHILASNIDQAVLLLSLRQPTTMSMFVDRFLVTAEAYKIPAILVFNKLDLYTDDDFEIMEDWSEVYSNAGYSCYHVSVRESIGIEGLKLIMSDKINLVSGNSGVGKSSLINSLIPGADLKTAEISEAHKSGKHTTTYPEMLSLQGGGYIIDTPGIKGFGTIDIKKEELYHFFPEIFAVSEKCKYHNCSHSHEPDCAVIKAVEDGEVPYMRYNNYLSMFSEEDEKYRKTPW
jgi:ribosome biogenesis GTPase